MITNAFTVDVENWCHASTGASFDALPQAEKRDGVRRGLEVLLELLDQANSHATFFVLGTVAEAVPEILKDIRDAGHEIGSHGYSHRRVDEMTPEEFDTDLHRAEEILGRVSAYRAPKWSLYQARSWAFDILARRGFRYDSSLFPVLFSGNPALPKTPYDIRTPSGVITELPPLSEKGFFTCYPMGGSWGLRNFFYFDIHRAVRRINRRGHPALFHLHPWEFDTKRPALKQPFWTRVAVSFRLVDLRKRVHRLLSDFSFGPLTQALNGNGRPTLTPEELP